MRKDLDELEIEFNYRANETFYLLFEEFEKTVKELNRGKDENVFQQERAKYMNSLKTELERVAISLVEKYREIKEVNQLRRNLTNRINEYVQEFMMKSQSN